MSRKARDPDDQLGGGYDNVGEPHHGPRTDTALPEDRIGRALDNEIVVNHSSVSRHHASIENSNGAFVVRDLNSQNGTFVGSRRVTEPTRVNDGEAVRFGDAQFTFRG